MDKTEKSKRRGHSARSVLSDPKQYISFFVALLIIQTIFWTLLITTGVNNENSDALLRREYKYHMVIDDISEVGYINIQNIERIYKYDKRLLWPATLDFLGYTTDGMGTRSYKIGVVFNPENPEQSKKDFWRTLETTKVGVGEELAEYTPRFTDNPKSAMQNEGLFKSLAIAFFILALLCAWLSNKCKAQRRDDGTGERIYVSTAKENMYITARRVFFTFMLLFGAAALVFLVLLLSIGNGSVYFLIYLALLIVCAAFLTELFNTRVNHYKFRYGIYMTYGAGFKKLYSTAVKEMMIISFITLLPSLGIASLICFAIYAPFGISMFIPSTAVFGVLILNIIIVLAATYLPMKHMAMKTPAVLLAAEDNSNLVVSPRRSFSLLGRGFPVSYELYGMWRFRKYFLRLVATAVSFATVFLCGLYIAHNDKVAMDEPVHEFEVNAMGKYSMPEDKIADVVSSIEENDLIKYLFWKDSAAASSVKMHALLQKDNVVRQKNVYNIGGDAYNRAAYLSAGFDQTTDSFELVAYNKTLLDTIQNNSIYNIEGDIYSILNDKNTVIVSEYISNLAHFDFDVGDKIVLAIPDEFAVDYNYDLIAAGKRDIAIEEMILQSNFEYREFTVGAIVDYGGSDGNFLVGMATDTYSSILTSADKDFEPKYMTNILVYTDENITADEIKTVSDFLKEEISGYYYTVESTNNTIKAKLDRNGGHHAIILTVSFLIMLISPLIWFFSQLRFYSRRNKEMFVLRAIGVVDKKMRSLYLVSGIFLAILSAIMTLGMSYLADYLIYLICTALVPSMTTVSGVTVSFYMPPNALVICLVSSVVCGFFSSYMPYLFRRILRSKSERYTIDGE